MPPTPRWMMLTVTSSCGQLGDLVLDRLQRAGDVGLDDQAELLDGALLGELEDVLERHLAARAARERLGLQAVGALAGELARAALVLDHAHVLAGLGHAVEAEHLDRLARRRALDARADEVVHRAHAAEVRAGDERVADLAACRAGSGSSRPGRGPGRAWTRSPRPRPRRRGWPSAPRGRRRPGSCRAARPGPGGSWRETSTNSISPPHSAGCRPCWVISVRTRSGCAPSLSILLTATTIGTSAALAWSIASSVCGLTPSSAATTITARSVTRAPRARIAVNASWPGVSRKVIALPPWWTW